MKEDQKNTLLQNLFDHVTESIIVTDQEGNIRLVNPATERIFGYNREEFYGKSIEFLMPERYSKNHINHRSNYNKNPHSRSMGIGLDLFALRKDGKEFPVEISLSPFTIGEKKYIIAFIIDITMRKISEQQIIEHQKRLELLTTELRASNERLESKVLDRTKILQEALTEIEKSRTELAEALEKEKELNELKSRFLSMASHEFRTPLTTILSSASLIGEYKSSEQQVNRDKHVDRIKSAVNNLDNILGDFLSLSKIEEGKVSADFKKFDLPKLIEDLKSEIKGITKTGQNIIHMHVGENDVILDPKLVKNILINLVSNAIKFSDENKNIYIDSINKSDKVEIRVKDDGMGISKEDLEHLFQRFFRGENAVNIPGTGLGLNIVARYIELMNGRIEVESKLEQGTTFSVTIPIKK